jgi:hypothetical protein
MKAVCPLARSAGPGPYVLERPGEARSSDDAKAAAATPWG